MLPYQFKRTKYTCYYTYLAMSSVFSLPPMLFMTFHELYNISYTLLGTLLLVNFCMQLSIDLIFTFFSKYFSIKTVIRVMPLLTSAGLCIYALVPLFFPEKAMIGLLSGTVVFSIAAGLCEVLLSPLVAALPSEHPEKDMSILHSLYGWGVVTVVAVSTVVLQLIGRQNWMYLTIFWALLPLIASVLFCVSPIPELNLESDDSGSGKANKSKAIFLCAVCIFLGSSSENIMTGWISSFMEKALLIPKAVGDIMGMAVFALLLACTRSLYAKYGKNIQKMLLFSMIGAAVCYIVVGCSGHAAVGFLACILTGICTSMLWPGTLILLEELVPVPGVAAYALMAACGDMGAALAPQLTGILVDCFSESAFVVRLSTQYAVSADQIGLKLGMLCAAIFPILGTVWMLFVRKSYSKALKNK